MRIAAGPSMSLIQNGNGDPLRPFADLQGVLLSRSSSYTLI